MSSINISNQIPSYVHNGLKVYILPKNQYSTNEDDQFFKSMHETLDSDTDDISITASFLPPSRPKQLKPPPPIPKPRPVEHKPLPISSKPHPISPKPRPTDIKPLNIDPKPRPIDIKDHTVYLKPRPVESKPRPVNIQLTGGLNAELGELPRINVDLVDRGLSVEGGISMGMQTDVSLVDERFILSKRDAAVKQADRSQNTDTLKVRHACSETDLRELKDTYTHTDTVYIFNQNEMEVQKEKIRNMQSAKTQLEKLLEEKNEKLKLLQKQLIPPPLQFQNTSVQTTLATSVNTSCQATTLSNEAICQTTLVTKDATTQHIDKEPVAKEHPQDRVAMAKSGVCVVMGTQTSDDEDELKEMRQLELTLQQNKLALERELRAKIGEIDHLESSLVELETNCSDANERNASLQQRIHSLDQQIEEKDLLIAELNQIRDENRDLKNLISDYKTRISSSQPTEDYSLLQSKISDLEAQLQYSKQRESELLERIDELLKEGKNLNRLIQDNNLANKSHNDLKIQFNDLKKSSDDLKNNISVLNDILIQKDILLKKLMDKEKINPIESKTNNFEDEEIQKILTKYENYHKPVDLIANKKKHLMRSIVDIGHPKPRKNIFELKLYEDLKNEYLGNPVNLKLKRNLNLNSSIPSAPLDFHASKQKSGKITLHWLPDKNSNIVQYQICINNSRTVTIANSNTNRLDLLLHQSELTRSTIILSICAITSEGVASQPSEIRLKNSALAPLKKHRSSEDIKNLGLSTLDGGSLGERRTCIAVYDYKPTGRRTGDLEEINLKTGDVIETFGEHRPDGFYIGRARGTKQLGLVPKHFVEELKQLKAPYLK